MKFSIQKKILLGFGIVLIISLFTQLVGYVLTEQFIRYQTEKNLSEKAQHAADQIQNFLSKIEVDHLGIAKEYIGNPKGVNAIIAYTIQQNPFFQRISVLNLSGKEITKVDRTGPVSKDSLSFEIPSEAFTTALKGQIGISKVYFTQDSPVAYVDIFTPILSETKSIAGVVKGQLRLDQLWDIIAKSNLGSSGFDYVVDDEGRLIAHPNTGLLRIGPMFSDRPIVASLLHLKYDTTQPTNTYVNERNVSVIASGYRIPDAHWAVIAEQPSAEALKDLPRLRILVFTTFTGSLLLLFFFSLVISKSITLPLSVLTSFAHHIEKGHFDSVAEIGSGDEMEELSISFNHMSQELKRYVTELNTKIAELLSEKTNLDEAVQQLMKKESDIRMANVELEKEKVTIAAERNKLAVILSGIQDAVIAVDLNRTIVLFNTAAEVLTGLKKDQVLNKPLGSILHLTANTEEIPIETFAPIRNDTFEGILFKKNEVELELENGEKKSVDIISAKIRESDSSNLGCILALHDVTEMHTLEEMKLDFVSMAAHELRTPLTIVRGYAQTLKDETETSLPDTQKEYLNRVLISVHTLSELIDNLLNVSRIEQGKLKISRGPLKMEDLVKEVFQGFESIAKSREQILEAHVQPDLPIILADRIRIAQVLSNLLANATNYSHPKSTIIVTAEKTTYIDKNPHDFIKISVKDNGPGIPKDALPHLFTKFFRVSGSLEQGSKGTGLGLYISKSIISLHNGEIWAESELDKGATFSFILPIATEEEIKNAQGIPQQSEHGIILKEEEIHRS